MCFVSIWYTSCIILIRPLIVNSFNFLNVFNIYSISYMQCFCCLRIIHVIFKNSLYLHNIAIFNHSKNSFMVRKTKIQNTIYLENFIANRLMRHYIIIKNICYSLVFSNNHTAEKVSFLFLNKTGSLPF